MKHRGLLLSVLVFGAAALAMPAGAMPAAPMPDDSMVVKVYGGCGAFGHRGPYGGCRAGGQAGGYQLGRACPPGFHLGPAGRRCLPN